MYEIVMSNGDRGEADTIAAVLVAAKQMHDDTGHPTSFGLKVVESITRDGSRCEWARIAASHHIWETS